jgi:hypothetical protein
MCLHVLEKNPPEVLENSCTCKAGKGICNHKIAFLYQTAHYSLMDVKTVPVIPSRTSMPQEGHKPRTAGVKPECLQDIIIRKPEFKVKKKKKWSIDGVQSSLYNPISKQFPPSQFVKDFQKAMITEFPETQFSKLFDPTEAAVDLTECKFGIVPEGSVLSYQQKLTPDFSNIVKIPQSEKFPNLPIQICLQTYNTVLKEKELTHFDGQQILSSESHEIEKETRDQSNNPHWIELRKKQINCIQI